MADLQNEMHFAPRLVVFITRAEDEKRLEHLFEDLHMPISYQCRGKGTAPSEMLDIFGLSGTTRLVTAGVVPRFMVADLFAAAGHKLHFRQRGAGIAFSLPVTGLQSSIVQMLNSELPEKTEQEISERIQNDMENVHEKSKYTAVWASVGSGYSDDVIDAAVSAGAKGGTVIKGRRRSSQRASAHLGISMQDGQDFVLVIVPKEKKNEIMAAISHACGLKTPAHGFVISLPVDAVLGLEE